MKILKESGISESAIKSLKNQGLDNLHSLSLLSNPQILRLFPKNISNYDRLSQKIRDSDPQNFWKLISESDIKKNYFVTSGIESLDRILGGKGLI
jgi:hypothetical protein